MQEISYLGEAWRAMWIHTAHPPQAPLPGCIRHCTCKL